MRLRIKSRLDRSALQGAVKSIFESKIRFFVPILLVGISKLYGSMWVYSKSIRDGIFQLPQMSVIGPIEPRWLYLFSAWDTSYYVNLARSYTFGRTFFPGYPFLIKFLNYVVNNYWLSAFILSITLGLASLPIFQSIAEKYMKRSEALGSTVIMSFFPYVFLFTTVGYSESLFLFAVLATWYFYLKDKVLFASIFSIVATLTKTYGILIVLPMLLDLLIHKKWKKSMITLASPILILSVMTPIPPQNLLGRIIMELNSATWAVGRVDLGCYWIRDYFTPFFTSSNPMVFFHFFHAYALAFIALGGYLVMNSAKIDWRLGIYSIVMFIVIILFGFVNGIPRYVSFIFPIWLVFRIRNPAIIVPLAFLFYLHSIILWYEFLWTMYPI